jgi:hypothetical protein
VRLELIDVDAQQPVAVVAGVGQLAKLLQY